MRSPLPPTSPQSPLWGPHARWRSLARMLRARHARHAGRQALDAVLRRPVTELFQPHGVRVSSHLSFNCFVTLKAAPRVAAPTAPAGAGRGRTRGVMAGSVIRERVMVVERHIEPGVHGRGRAMVSPLSPLVSRRRGDAVQTGTTNGDATARRGTTAAAGVANGRADQRVFAAPRGLLQTEEAAQTFGQLVRRFRRQESRMTPVAAVARRAPDAPRSERDDLASHERAFTAPRIGMGMPTAMQMQAAADVNIEALASKVMQQIDRRLVAHRERMGRI